MSEYKIRMTVDYTVLVFPMELLKVVQEQVQFYKDVWETDKGYRLVAKDEDVEFGLVSDDDLPTTDVAVLSMKETMEENNRLTRENDRLADECKRLKKLLYPTTGSDVAL